jgi:hypothetical protein
MKTLQNIVAILLTIFLTWLACDIFYTVKNRIDLTTHYSDVARPLQVALAEIKSDMNEGKLGSARKKLNYLAEQVDLLGIEITENHLNSIFDEYRKINRADNQTNPEPVDAANASNAASVNLNQSARIR